MKETFSVYAASVLDMNKKACAVAKDVSKFYAKSAARQKSVQSFVDAQFTLDNTAFSIFKEEFGWEIAKVFDDWVEELHKMKKNVATAEKTREKVAHLSSKLKQAEAKGSSQTQELKKQLSDLAGRYNRMFQALDQTVNQTMETRFGQFDRCFVRLMEAQMDFFRSSVKCTDSFHSNVTVSFPLLLSVCSCFVFIFFVVVIFSNP